MSARMVVFRVVLATVLCASSGLTQVAETVQINLVEIPVNVFDKNGETIRGLKPENFEVYDDNERRAITHFEEIDLAKISTSPDEVISPAARRNFLLVFDLSHSSPKALLRARDSAQEFVEENLLPRDLVAVATFSIENGFRILTAFTTDRSLVSHAIRTLGHPQFYETRDPLLLAMTADPGVTSQEEPSEDVFTLSANELVRFLQNAVQVASDAHARQRIERQLVMFGHMARMLDSVRGRKQVILLSEGFDARLIQGQQTSGPEEERELELLALTRGEIWRIDNDQRFGSVRTLKTVTDMTHVFRRSDVVIHAIDIRGIPGASDPRTGARGASSESHFLMADATGGEVFKNTNDFSASFARMLKQQEVVYILGFQTKPSGSPGKFHDLSVKVKVVGYRGLRVNHRAGYYEPRVQVSAVEQRLSATDILMNDIPFDEVEVHLLAVPIPLPQGNAQVPVVAEITGGDLLERVPGEALNLELFLYAFDQRNRVRDFLFQTVALDLAKIKPMLRHTGIKYYGTLSLPPGEYSLKALVRVVETGSNGFRRVHLKVPAYGDPAVLPPLVFEEPGKWLMLKGAKTAEGQVDYPFTLMEESFIPSVRPKLVSGQTYRVAMFTYNLPSEQVELTARLEGADGTQQNPALKLLGRTTSAENGGVKLLLGFTPSQPPGDYSLHVAVRQQDASSASEVSLPLRIEPAQPQ